MAEGRSRLEWAQTSLIAAFLYNPNRPKGTAAKPPAAFDPHAARPKGVDFAAIRQMIKKEERRDPP